MSLRTAYKYFKTKKSVRRLPRDLITDFDVTALDDDELLLIMDGRVKDRHMIDRLRRQHGLQRAADLIPLLPRRKKTPLRKRIMDWLRRIEGSYEHDPIRGQLRKPREDVKGGILHRRMKRVGGRN